MPEMDGYEATSLIRQLGNGKRDIPIIAMTASAIRGDREKCIQVRAIFNRVALQLTLFDRRE